MTSSGTVVRDAHGTDTASPIHPQTGVSTAVNAMSTSDTTEKAVERTASLTASCSCAEAMATTNICAQENRKNAAWTQDADTGCDDLRRVREQ